MNKTNPSKIKALMNKNTLRAKKRFGQNFLTDDNILKKIVAQADIQPDSVVMEIGPGLGGLTQHLLKQAKKVLAYEIDETLIPILEDMFLNDALTLIHDDVLKRDLSNDLKHFAGNAPVILVANLPYYITTPILMKCLEHSQIKRMVLLAQLEVAKRLTAKPGTKDYNALSVLIAYRAKTRLAFKVPRQVFMPAPRVDSGLIVLDYHETPPVQVSNESYFIELVRASFKQKRKTLLNNLDAFLQTGKASIIEMFETLNIPHDIRAEHLELKTFGEMADYLFKPRK